MNTNVNTAPGFASRLLSMSSVDFQACLFAGYLVLLIVLSLAAPYIIPYAPDQQDLMHTLEGPSWAHLFGTDDLGRDILVRALIGARVSLYACTLAIVVACCLGIPVGLMAGFFGGWVDDLIGRLIDTMLSFPAIVLAIAVTGALGAGLTNAMIAIGLVYSPLLARLTRAQTMVIRNELYVDAARCFGASTTRLLLKHILPNAVQPLIVQATLLLATALLAESGLSFLGLGVQLPQPSWGTMLARAYNYMDTSPNQMLVPGFAIMLTALSFNGLGEWLRVRLGP
jgi:peptide/nickel transport system permease protein